MLKPKTSLEGARLIAALRKASDHYDLCTRLGGWDRINPAATRLAAAENDLLEHVTAIELGILDRDLQIAELRRNIADLSIEIQNAHRD